MGGEFQQHQKNPLLRPAKNFEKWEAGFLFLKETVFETKLAIELAETQKK